ncbi:PVC-type heme-binding CxxCH protein [Shivajiella indica]|uniref:PVC-type heme-binding CxxCH protein n=1 Tax=Shivajiella indica TaxID=872115 RepID=A0ABW5B799_9BACT
MIQVKSLGYNLIAGLIATFITLSACQKKQKGDVERSLENALSTFELEEGFQIELIAGEPLIADPVDMEIDEFGRMYVVEMHGYPLDLSGSGKIRLLSDSDGDGIMDKSIVFAEGLMLPTGIMRWKNGILVTDPPNVLYLEDTDGDGKADNKEIILTGFALSNPQHNVNSPRLGLDNWIYLGHEPAVSTSQYEEEFGDRGTEIFYPGKPDGTSLSQNAGGRSVRFRPDKFQLEVLASRTQFGHTFDPWGRRFVVNNNNHIIHDVIAARYLNRNPFLVVPASTESISDHGNAAEVFPITINPQHQLLTDVGVMTSACGITAYLGSAFPHEYDHAVFVAEPVSNILHIDFISENKTGFVASRQHQDKEFLASTDSWFRPVNMYIGPDGALYVVDYYRQIIEHPEWMAEDVVKSGALYNGTDQGRIYRISTKGTKPLDWSNNIQLGDFTDEELVQKLEDPNIWWRRNAQRLLLDRNPSKVPEVLLKMAENTDSPIGRVHALWTLEGMGKTNLDLVVKALSDPEPGVRENAVKIAELHLDESPQIVNELVKLKSDGHPKVRFQLLCTLGYFDSPLANQAKNELLFANLDDPWMQVAALSAPFEENQKLIKELLANYDSQNPNYGTLLQRLSTMVGAGQDLEYIKSLVTKATISAQTGQNSWQAPLLRGLALGLRSKNINRYSFTILEGPLSNACMNHPSFEVKEASFQLLQVIGLSETPGAKELIQHAKSIAPDKNYPKEERVLAIHILSLQDPAPIGDLLKDLINPSEPNEIQVAAIRTHNKISGIGTAEFIVAKWPNLTPEIRDEGLKAMMTNDDRITVLLDAMDQGKIQPSSLGWERSVRLMNHSDENLRNRSRSLINKNEKIGKEALQQYQEALALNGSPLNGKSVYQSNCAICHQMGQDLGMAFGPDLATLRNRRPENILSDIILPGLSIADGYDLWLAELNNGEKIQGIVASETPNAVLFRPAGGREISVSRQDIKSLQVLDYSAMPTGLENNINQQEMADLIAFIKNWK